MNNWFRQRWAFINSSRIINAFYMTIFEYIFLGPFFLWLSSITSDSGLRNMFCIGMPMIIFVLSFLLWLGMWRPLDVKFILKEIESCKECKGYGYYRVKCDCCNGKGYRETK